MKSIILSLLISALTYQVLHADWPLKAYKICWDCGEGIPAGQTTCPCKQGARRPSSPATKQAHLAPNRQKSTASKDTYKPASQETLCISAPNLPSTPPKGRFVKITIPNGGPLSLAEVEVISNGVNVARQGTATQSTTGYNAHPNLAIDGCNDGFFAHGSATHTYNRDKSPYWQLDLKQAYPIEKIVIWNRNDRGCSKRLANYTVTISDDKHAVVWGGKLIPHAAIYDTHIPTTTKQTYQPAKMRLPQYIRISLPHRGIISLAEIEVFSNGVNVAGSGTVRQSSTYMIGQAKLAIDGNKNGDYNKALSHTHHGDPSSTPYWQLALKGPMPIEKIVIWNRSDPGLHSRLNGMLLTILDRDFKPIWQEAVEKPSQFDTVFTFQPKR